MTVRSLYTAASGMDSLQIKLDAIANNLANANTTGFKRSRVNFEDLYYQQIKLPGTKNQQGNITPEGVQIGIGTQVTSTQLDQSQGALLQTSNQLDVAIVGQGFFQVQDANAGILYTRAGNFSVNADGQVVMSSGVNGRLLSPSLQIPQDATNIGITSDGIVTVQLQNQPTLNQVGDIQLVRFMNPQGLLQLGENLYQATDASGNAFQGQPGLQGMGTLRQGFLEGSNSEPVQELVDLITTQRTFELNSQMIQASDQVLQLVNNLRRF